MWFLVVGLGVIGIAAFASWVLVVCRFVRFVGLVIVVLWLLYCAFAMAWGLVVDVGCGLVLRVFVLLAD